MSAVGFGGAMLCGKLLHFEVLLSLVHKSSFESYNYYFYKRGEAVKSYNYYCIDKACGKVAHMICPGIGLLLTSFFIEKYLKPSGYDSIALLRWICFVSQGSHLIKNSNGSF